MLLRLCIKLSLGYCCIFLTVNSSLYGQANSPVIIEDVKDYLGSSHSDLVIQCNRRKDKFTELDLAYEIWSEGKRLSSVHLSDDYTVMLGVERIVCLSKYGGFILKKVKGKSAKFRLEAAVTASEVRAGNDTLKAFITRAGFEKYGISPHTNPPNQIVSPLEFFAMFGYSDVKVSQHESDTIRLNYRFQTQRKDAGPMISDGEMVISPVNDYGLLKHTENLLNKNNGEQVGTVVTELTYQQHTNSIPLSLPASLRIEERLGHNPPYIVTWEYKNYRIEQFPEEQLHLAYYGLPNELVEDESWTDTNLLWIAIAAVFLIAVTVVLYRYRRGRASR